MNRASTVSPPPAAVVVCYFPDSGFKDRLARIRPCVDRLLVWDNSTDVTEQNSTRTTVESVGAEYRSTGENLGTARAFNRAFEELAVNEVQYAVAFDQDSEVDAACINSLIRFAAQHPSRRWAAIGAQWFDVGAANQVALQLTPNPSVPVLFHRRPATVDRYEATFVIMSGTLFELPLWREIGGFDESLFLDMVDIEFCLRARSRGFAVGVAYDAHLLHQRGQKQSVKRWGRTWLPSHIPPGRLETMFRNRVWLWRRHALHFPHWAIYELVYSLKILADIVAAEPAKRIKVAACLRGLWRGLSRPPVP